MTASLRRRRPRPGSLAPPLDDDDLLCEILLRLPPLPSSLPRASAVCKRWRRLLSDPGFLRRFRIHHRRKPPLLGFFNELNFVPTLDPPDRVPAGRFSLQLDIEDGDRVRLLGCRHGLVLIFHAPPRFPLKISQASRRHQLLVWDPVTGDQHRIAVPTPFDTEEALINGAVLRAAGDAQHFQVVLVAAESWDNPHRRALACVYSSETGIWCGLISTPLPSKDPTSNLRIVVFTDKPAVLVGKSLCWLLGRNSVGVLEFDLERHSLAVIPLPVDVCAKKNSEFGVMPAEGGGLGLLLVSEPDFSIQLWKRKTDCDGVASWGLGRTIELDELLPLNSEEKGHLTMLGFSENNNVVFLWTVIGLFMVQLESLRFKKLFKTNIIFDYHPFESAYTTGMGIGGGHDGAELLHEI